MASERLNEDLIEYRQAINERVSRFVTAKPPQGFYDMMRYELELDDAAPVSGPSMPLAQACSLLCVLAYRAVAGQPSSNLEEPALSRGLSAAIDAGAAIELLTGWFHIHRDIEEETPTAGGRPSLSSRWGYAQAINTGDGMYPLAARAMLAAVDDPELALTLIRELTHTSLSYMEGRYRELTFKDRSNRPSEAYLEVAELTTGALMGYSAWAGAVIGGAGDKVQAELRNFGANLGIARGLREGILFPTARRAPDKTNLRDAKDDPLSSGDSAGHYLETALDALERAAMAPSSRQRLAAFARECISVR